MSIESYQKEDQKDKDVVLDAIFAITQDVLVERNHYDVIPKGLERLGKAIDADRVYYWENNIDPVTGQQLTSQVFEWCRPGVSLQIDNRNLQELPFDLVFDFLEPLKSGIEHNIIVDELQEGHAKQLLIEQEIVSLLALPVMISDNFWGFVGFDDCHRARKWTELELSLLRFFVSILAKGIERNQLEEKFSRAFHAGGAMMIISRQDDDVILEVNDAAAATLCYDRAKMCGKKLQDCGINLFAGVRVPNSSQILPTGLEKEPILDGHNREIMIEDALGKTLIGLYNVQTIDIVNIPCYLITITNITERKKMEEELLRARQEAEAASLAKSHFISNVSHELKTPLNAIMAYADLLANEPYNDHRQAYIKQIENSASLLLDLINHLLDYNQLELGKNKLSYKTFNLNKIVEQAVNQVISVIEQKQLKLKIDFADNLPSLMLGDDLKIYQILLNLLDNAVKFTEKGTISIRVQALQATTDGLKVMFSIEDTGIGIDNTKLQEIFHPFQQADEHISAHYGGTGLGLAISQSLVKLHGGEIDITSKLGLGTRVNFTIAIKNATALEAEIKGKTKQVKRVDKPVQYKILAVEDNAINRQVLTALLKDTSIDVVTARSGQEALRLAVATRFDLVLTDIIMPDMDGYETTFRLRSLPGYEHKPIIALTAVHIDPQSNKYQKAAFTDHLEKPLTRRVLLNKILTYLPPALTQILEDAQIDYDKSISRFEYDWNFYLDLLQQFRKDYENWTKQATTLISKSTMETNVCEELLLLIHTLKGSAVEIGAEGLALLASDYEQTIKIKIENIKELSKDKKYSSPEGHVLAGEPALPAVLPELPAELRASLQDVLTACEKLKS